MREVYVVMAEIVHIQEQQLIEPQEHMYIAYTKAIGVDAAWVTAAITQLLRPFGYNDPPVQISVSNEMVALAKQESEVICARGKCPLEEYYLQRMDLGDRLRASYDASIGAHLAVAKISELRKKAQSKQIYIIDSLMHPSEVDLLRAGYGDHLILIAITEDYLKRKERLFEGISSYHLKGKDSEVKKKLTIENKGLWHGFVEGLMLRERGSNEWRRNFPEDMTTGQDVERTPLNVSKTFEKANVYVSGVDQKSSVSVLMRVFDLYFGSPMPTPTIDEVAMAHAFVAARSSAATARRVGAVIFSRNGEQLSTGFNEVPKATGGPYYSQEAFAESVKRGEETPIPFRDAEFSYQDPVFGDEVTGADPNDRIKIEILRDLIRQISSHPDADCSQDIDTLVSEILSSGEAKVLDVIEYGRTVHAEMHAIIQCARLGTSLRGAVLYTTTFPCHECARHIVAAGISRVVFLEAYPKSKVDFLHPDSIEATYYTGPGGKELGINGGHSHGRERVRFSPFLGISPRSQGAYYSWIERKYSCEVGLENAGHLMPWQRGDDCIKRMSRYDGLIPAYAVVKISAFEQYCESIVHKGLLF